MSGSIHTGKVFKLDNGDIFIVHKILKRRIPGEKRGKYYTEFVARRLTRGDSEYIVMRLTVDEMRRYMNNLTDIELAKLDLLGIRYNRNLKKTKKVRL